MIGIDDAVAAGSKLIDDAINKIWPDPQDRAKAEVMMLQAQSDAALNLLKTQMSVMLAEAQSTDKFTSRARPGFLYVVYLLMLCSIPMGILYSLNPAIAGNVTTGFKDWLAAIPPDIISMFQFVMLGYIGGRSFEKVKGIK